MIFFDKGKEVKNINNVRRMKMKKKQNSQKNTNAENEEQHSMVCNDQLFFQELRIAAEEAERDRTDTDQSTT
jgi:hypothetical protein